MTYTKENEVNFIHTKDATQIFYKDWGSGAPIVFCHGWPLNSDAWDAQMVFFSQNGYRVIAHDRRGHGRSGQPNVGNDMDTYADDLASLIESLDLRDVTLVGHSTGGGEVARYIGRHGTGRVSKVALIGAVPPLMLKTDSNPDGLPGAVFDGIRAGVFGNRSQFYRELAYPFFGFNRKGADIIQGTLEAFWLQGMSGSIYGQYLCVREFSEVDFSSDLTKIDVPTLILQGDDDQIVPIEISGRKSAAMVRGAVLKVYPGASHGMCTVNASQVNADLLEFIKSPLID